MKLLEEMEGPTGIRARLVQCECADDDCETVWTYAQVRQANVFSSRERFWLALGFGRLESMRSEAGFLIQDIPDDGVSPSETIDRGVACLGLTWARLLDLDVAARQLFAWEKLPAEFEVFPVEMAWRVRAISFGEPLTRVPRAVAALLAYYAPDGPVPPEMIVDA